MWRARRLKLIADSFRPAFESTTGTQWWLAEVETSPEAAQPISTAAASTAPALASVQVSSAESATSRTLPCSPKCTAPDAIALATPYAGQDASQDEGPTYSFADTFEEKLTWDSRACCFIRA
jgi:hypothetical protein